VRPAHSQWLPWYVAAINASSKKASMSHRPNPNQPQHLLRQQTPVHAAYISQHDSVH